MLIFDEVVTGFRLGLQSAQGKFGVTPDLTTLAKAVDGGFPVSVYGGKTEIMELMTKRKWKSIQTNLHGRRETHERHAGHH